MKARSQQGLTLVETLITVALVVIVVFAINESMIAFYKANSYSLAQSYEIYNARKGVERFVRDAREMTYADDGTFPLARMEPHIVGFYSDIDRDESVEYIEYELATSTLFTKRVYNARSTSPTYDTSSPDEEEVLSTNVQNLTYSTSTFYYYDENGTALTGASDLTNVHYVDAKVIVNIDPVRNPGEFMLAGSAALRNVIQE